MKRTGPGLWLVVAIALLSGCGGGGATPAGSGAPLRAARAIAGNSLLARVPGRSVAIYRQAADARPYIFLRNPNRYGFPTVFLVRRSVPGWLNVYLPQRPNGSTGWIRQPDVRLSNDPYLVVVNLHKHAIKLWRAGHVVIRARIGVGRAVTPTPAGVYFITDLFRLTNPNGFYGPYGFGLSAYSNVLHEFAGGDGQIGLHGTNDPTGLGSNVSHGCIRLLNRDITLLARLLPLGTPVRISR